MTTRILRSWLTSLLLLAFTGLFASGCSLVNDFNRWVFDEVDAGMDAGPDSGMMADGGTDAGVDGGTDAGTDAGIDAGPRPPTSVVQTSGGAVINSATHRLRVSFGAPQPMGSRSDSTHRLRVGPQTQPE